MNKTEINEFLAREVMGWTKHPGGIWWIDTEGGGAERIKTWAPCDNIAQAVECAKGLPGFYSYEVRSVPPFSGEYGGYTATVGCGAGWFSGDNIPSDAYSLSLAVARAAGFTDTGR